MNRETPEYLEPDYDCANCEPVHEGSDHNDEDEDGNRSCRFCACPNFKPMDEDYWWERRQDAMAERGGW